MYWLRYIDDGLVGVWNWMGTPKCITAFENFKQEINATSLNWEVSSPKTCSNFLDLTLTICNGVIESTLFKKALSLHLYIPHSSTHPPSILRELITGSLLQIIWLTSNCITQKNHISQFFCLMACSYTYLILDMGNKKLQIARRHGKQIIVANRINSSITFWWEDVCNIT